MNAYDLARAMHADNHPHDYDENWDALHPEGRDACITHAARVITLYNRRLNACGDCGKSLKHEPASATLLGKCNLCCQKELDRRRGA